jgi:D-amino-acid dehydrogenase
LTRRVSTAPGQVFQPAAAAADKHTRPTIIIGGGVIGLCCALYARERGWRVTVIERDGPQRNGCSYGNAGMITPSHFVPLAAPGMVALGLRWMLDAESPFHVQPRLSWDLARWGWRFCRSATPGHVRRTAPLLRDLHLASRAAYVRLAEELDADFGLKERGMLMLCKTARDLHEEAHIADMARRLGLAAEVLDAKQLAEVEPDLRLDVVGGVRYPQDASLDPRRFMDGLQGHLERNGVDFRWNTHVRDWQASGGRIVAVRTDRGDIEGDEFVLAGGSWTAEVAKPLQLDLPMQPGKGYSLTLAAPRQMPRHGLICVEARLAVTPLGPALRFGGTMELAGMTEAVNPARVRGIVRAVPQYFPDFRADDFANITPWCGLRPCTPDGLPYLGRPRRWDNLIVAAGHAMMGLSLGPVTGQIVAQLLAREQPQFDLHRLAPDRFA